LDDVTVDHANFSGTLVDTRPQISFSQTLVGGTASVGCNRKLGLTWTVDWSIIVGLARPEEVWGSGWRGWEVGGVGINFGMNMAVDRKRKNVPKYSIA
jgi:hypothetical protein